LPDWGGYEKHVITYEIFLFFKSGAFVWSSSGEKWLGWFSARRRCGGGSFLSPVFVTEL